MLSKLLRVMLVFVVAASVLFVSLMRANAWNQARTDHPDRALGTGTLFAQPVDPSGKLYLSAWLDPDGSDFDQKIWDNFTLQSDATITEIDWFGAYDPLRFGAGGPVLDFTVAIYPSIAAGTEPAVAFPPLVEYQTGGNAGETPIGIVGGVPMYAYAFNLPVSFSSTAGVKYWVHIVASQGGSSPDWCLAAGSGGNGSHYRWGSGSGGDSGYRSVPGDAAFTLVGPVLDAPTDILLSINTIDENLPVNTVIGELTAIDPNPAATFIFSFTCATAGIDDGSFNILGTSLRSSTIFDYELKSSYSICIRVTDKGGLYFDKNFTININKVFSATRFVYLPSIVK